MRGRPRKGKEKKIRTSLTIDSELLHEINQLALKSNLSKSETIEKMLDSQIKFIGKKTRGLPYPVSKKEIEVFCEKFNILKLSLFGSIVTGNFKIFKSDIDLLVEFIQSPGLFEIVRMQDELRSIFSYKNIDLRTKQEIAPEIFKSISSDLEVFYEKAK